MARACAWCKGHMGQTEGEGVTHGICAPCEKKHFPAYYAAMRDQDAMMHGRSAQVRGGLVNLALMGMLAGMR